MRTVKDIDLEIKDLDKEYNMKNKNTHTERALKKAGTRREFLLFVKKYLESKPLESVVKAQLTECERKIKLIVDGFAAWKKNVYKQEVDGVDPLKVWSKLNEEAKIKKQIKTLRYILNE